MKIINKRYDPAVAVTNISPHPRNPRRGAVDAIMQSIDHNGFYGACVVQESTGYILAGNYRHQAAVYRGAETLPVIFIDCDDATADRILVADNRSNDLGQ